MGLVRGISQKSAVCFSIEPTYNAVQSEPLTFRVPLIEETLTVNRALMNKNRESGLLGATGELDYGSRLVRGQIKTRGRFNSTLMAQMLAYGCGGQYQRRSSVGTDGQACGATMSSHIFTLADLRSSVTETAGGLSKSLTIIVWKGGESATPWREVFTGCMITGFEWNQPELDAPTLTFDVIGQFALITQAGGSPTAPIAVVASAERLVGARHLNARNTGQTNMPGIFQVGTPGGTSRPWVADSWSLKVTGGTDFPLAYLTQLDTFEKPIHKETWSAEVTIEHKMRAEDLGDGLAAPAATYPFYDWVVRNAIKFRTRYVLDKDYDLRAGTDSAASATASIPAVLDFYVKNMVITEARRPLQDLGNPRAFLRANAVLATYTTTETALATDQKNIICLQMSGADSSIVSSSDSGSGDHRGLQYVP